MKKSHRATDQTLQEYLDALLRPAAASAQPAAAEPRPFAEPVTPRVVLPRLAPVEVAPSVEVVAVQAAPAVQVAPAVNVSPPAELVVPAKSPPQLEPVAAVGAPLVEELRPESMPGGPAVASVGRPWIGGRPSWAQSRFECLLFAVGGLNLAVPLAELGTIYTLQAGDVAPLPGQADWFMGLLANRQQHIRVVDAARVVMPERYQPTMRDSYRYVITLNGSDWGLAVDQVANALPLSPDQVRWRGERAKRAWLAGTVVEHMCALLDPEQLVAQFQSQDHRRAGGSKRR